MPSLDVAGTAQAGLCRSDLALCFLFNGAREEHAFGHQNACECRHAILQRQGNVGKIAASDALYRPGGNPQLHATALARHTHTADAIRAHGDWPSNPAFAAALVYDEAI
jgi:hypothetical protein